MYFRAKRKRVFLYSIIFFAITVYFHRKKTVPKHDRIRLKRIKFFTIGVSCYETVDYQVYYMLNDCLKWALIPVKTFCIARSRNSLISLRTHKKHEFYTVTYIHELQHFLCTKNPFHICFVVQHYNSVQKNMFLFYSNGLV